uniref:Uncharacterized protein n=1 Tax=Panagrolaimus davidi TaxID=227884 RepID=A0A914QSZ5_9BILA
MLDKNEKAFEEVLERVQTNNPRYVLLSPSDIKNPLFISLSKLSFSNFGILYDDATLCKANLVDGISKWLLDKTSVKYYVHPTCARKHRVMNTACKELITVDLYDHLPLNKSCIIPKSVDLLFIQEIEQASGKINHDCKKMEQKCHRNKITLSIDTNNFAKFASEPVILPQIQTLPLTLNETDESNIPVIAFCDNFSVICIHKDGGYKFVDGWNGKSFIC